MSVRLFTIAGSVLACSAAPALASSGKGADLPFTPAFEQAVGQYRDCVIAKLDRSSPARPEAMARAALAACGASHEAVRAQLAADIVAARPGVSIEVAARSASDGMATINPMIAAVALDHAEAMIGAASADAPVFAGRGNIG